MSGLRMDSDLPRVLHVDLDDVRNQVKEHTRARPDRIKLAVEYVGGRIRVYEVDRFLIEGCSNNWRIRTADLFHKTQGTRLHFGERLKASFALTEFSEGHSIHLPRTRLN